MVLGQIFRIVVIDLVLSGDNAVVIGMAAHRLEARQRRLATAMSLSALSFVAAMANENGDKARSQTLVRRPPRSTSTRGLAPKRSRSHNASLNL